MSLGDEIGLIANCETFSNLEILAISSHKLGNAGLSDIFNSPFLKKLKTLTLSNNEFNNFGIASLGTFNLCNLSELTLDFEHVKTEDIQLMCRNQLFSNLRKLVLKIWIQEQDFSNILTNSVWVNLKELEFSCYRIEDRDKVLNIKCTLQLEKLKIHASNLEVCRALVNNKTISRSLKYLDVGGINGYHDNPKDKRNVAEIKASIETFIFMFNDFVF
ncbi:predicted protein [Naegleria gruberi]|uniref:Predicted protein n=1 Tax=Naegleria gruberi TaxID=5762 RepID=D2VK79_NAEGR|nr:uncharacterized protein NAEGRDRAFT_69299 [Naegleria gruberi]EFC42901.1 predicted protein [Naegleria gruberi]|eukprot:XP_002675645.1 predicted protein [Naegleria gruberi strain NEG-M]